MFGVLWPQDVTLSQDGPQSTLTASRADGIRNTVARVGAGQRNDQGRSLPNALLAVEAPECVERTPQSDTRAANIRLVGES
jgi:hypothetical protein